MRLGFVSPFYRGEKLRAQGHTGHLTSVSSALNPHAALAFSSASLLFRERLVCSPNRLPPLKGGPWRRIATHSVSSLSAPSLPPGTVSPRPLSQHLLQGQFKLPIGPQSRSGPLRGSAGEQQAQGKEEGEGKGARSPQPRRVWAAATRGRGGRGRLRQGGGRACGRAAGRRGRKRRVTERRAGRGGGAGQGGKGSGVAAGSPSYLCRAPHRRSRAAKTTARRRRERREASGAAAAAAPGGRAC